jgi:hypothetical protein
VTSPFFLVGCPRSGTTLLRNLLNSHPQLAIPAESQFLPTFYRAWGNPRDARAAERLGRRILALWWVRRWAIDLGPRDFSACRTYAALVEILYGEILRRDGATRWGDKTPAYALQMPVISEIFPEAQFVHILRDGRDVAGSLVKTHIGPREAVTAGLFWRRYVETARRDGARLGPRRYFEVSYESLLSDTATTLRAVCAFLGVPFDPRVLEQTSPDVRGFPDVYGPRRAGQASASEIVQSNSGKWRREMSARELGRFESVAGALLVELGYELGSAERRPPPGAAALLARSAFERLLRAGYQLRRRHIAIWLPGELQLKWAGVRARWRARAASIGAGPAERIPS